MATDLDTSVPRATPSSTFGPDTLDKSTLDDTRLAPRGKRLSRASKSRDEQAESTPEKPHVNRRTSPETWRHGYDWASIIWIGSAHLACLYAPFCFTWQGLVTFLLFWWITGSLGVCLGYHRLLTHGSFRTYRPIRWLFALLGGLSGEGSAITWVATHRKHHEFSDEEGDPHTPRDGGLWSHMTWLLPSLGKKGHEELTTRYAPDLLKDRMMSVLHSTFLFWHFALGASLYAIGYFGWGTQVAVSMLVWGMGLRLVWVLHVTWFVNSASHMWGYKNYETNDESRNLWWVGLVAFGEGWHNNHHAYQRMARHGHRWWEIDVTYWAIVVMEKLGLAWDVVHDVAARKRLVNL